MRHFTLRLNLAMKASDGADAEEQIRLFADAIEERVDYAILEIAEEGSLPPCLRNYSLSARLVRHRR